MRSCKEMKIRTVALFSEADRTSMHVWYADEACCVGGAASKDSYLNMEKIIEITRRCKADAIHPGYGFLSENAHFAARCRQEGIIFIGPTPETMEAMGDKISARKRMIEAGVPVVPGTERGLNSVAEALETARQIGFPLMLKASMGGGGRGIRLVCKEEELEEAYLSAKSESLSSFGDDTVYMEKFIEEPHHIEFQLLGDNYGNIIHLCERECSIQRRNQKIVEESPSPFMTPELRREMGEKAVLAAKAVGYTGAGTIEFLVDKHRHFFFLEMNTRLQVEHPITEEVLGVDLVKEQIKIAAGQALTLKQEDVRQRGHAIELRICAEDPEQDFTPSPGTIKTVIEPNGIGVRIDSYVYEGYEIPVYYDPMISKLIVWAVNRTYAIERLHRVLQEYKISGIKTNIPYLKSLIDVPAFVEGEYNTGFIARYAGELISGTAPGDPSAENIALIAAYIDYIVNLEENSVMNTDSRPTGRWRNFGLHKGILRI
jgi:acetyl-CoA carboxylase biotin carboxylase subunit